MSDSIDLDKLAEICGWSQIGVTTPHVDNLTQDRFNEWLTSYKGPQMNYLERRKVERLDPKKYFQDVQSIIVFIDYYFRGWAQGSIKASTYSYEEDYHLRLTRKLEETAQHLQTIYAPFTWKASVDTAPLLEKYFAVQAGLGWQGKNTLVLNHKLGSQFFIGSLLTSIPIDKFKKANLTPSYCGTCTRCLDACPTNALDPYVLKADKCISYWTLEHKGSFSEKTPAYKEWIAGCDICQEVCPWNQKLVPLHSSEHPLKKLNEESIKSKNWNHIIKDTALNYVPEENWVRNLEHIQSSES